MNKFYFLFITLFGLLASCGSDAEREPSKARGARSI